MSLPMSRDVHETRFQDLIGRPWDNGGPGPRTGTLSGRFSFGYLGFITEWLLVDLPLKVGPKTHSEKNLKWRNFFTLGRLLWDEVSQFFWLLIVFKNVNVLLSNFFFLLFCGVNDFVILRKSNTLLFCLILFDLDYIDWPQTCRVRTTKVSDLKMVDKVRLRRV